MLDTVTTSQKSFTLHCTGSSWKNRTAPVFSSVTVSPVAHDKVFKEAENYIVVHYIFCNSIVHSTRKSIHILIPERQTIDTVHICCEFHGVGDNVQIT